MWFAFCFSDVCYTCMRTTQASIHENLCWVAQDHKCEITVTHTWLKESPQALFSPLLLTGGNLKIRAAALLWTRFDCRRSIWEHQCALHSWHRALLAGSTVWHRTFGRCSSSATTVQAARSPRISAQFWGCKSTFIVKNSTLQGIVNLSPFKKWPLQRVPHFKLLSEAVKCRQVILSLMYFFTF